MVPGLSQLFRAGVAYCPVAVPMLPPSIASSATRAPVQLPVQAKVELRPVTKDHTRARRSFLLASVAVLVMTAMTSMSAAQKV